MSESLTESPACRILVVSSSIKQAVAFIYTIQGYDSVQENADVHPVTIPWSIVNKYYTAKVHFEAHAVSHWNAQSRAPAVPAIIFVWAQGESYKGNIERLSTDLAGYDPEVSLAVRVPNSVPVEDSAEDDSATDEFLSSHGFEFVNASPYNSIDCNNLSSDDSYSDSIPRLPRVVDALSTIMWPSMQSHDPATSKQAKVPDVKIRELLDWAQDTFDTIPTHDPNAEKAVEKDEFERWLSNSVVHDDPWKDVAGTVTISPVAMTDSDTHQGSSGRPFGFDDDFTVFVSAPVADGQGGRGIGKTIKVGNLSLESDTSFEGDDDESKLSASGSQYRSLGSASDVGSEYGDGDVQYEAMKDDEDDGLPTEEEIRATSARIFGVPPPLSKTNASVVDVNTPTTGKTSFFDDEFSAPQDNPEDENDVAPFDFSRVLTTLEGMKTKIAGIEDVGERRKAAARVALGLVHGLEGGH